LPKTPLGRLGCRSCQKIFLDKDCSAQDDESLCLPFENKCTAAVLTFADKITLHHDELNEIVYGQAPVATYVRFPDEVLNPSDIPCSLGQIIFMASTCNAADQPLHIHCRRARAVLTAQQAYDIYIQMNPDEIVNRTGLKRSHDFGDSVSISRQYCISPKAVRDVWSR
jgi:hypothetical protein